MADDGASDSEGSNISGVNELMNEDFEGEIAGENVDPLDRAQDGGDDETRPQWIDNLFHESDESGDEFEGFHPDWVTDPRAFALSTCQIARWMVAAPTNTQRSRQLLLLWPHVG
ncbi:hypothetical protein NP493_896g00054 [Ridgeia piscesae]|uniref:Uncharacterized protein n=1 Tax=Ridgeia piscesae TaxID=27915 RepID=A0AAD9KL12_RIDPI|nr:hypothetical protein NP493_896g00054 [Ridgeia piscesae]